MKIQNFGMAPNSRIRHATPWLQSTALLLCLCLPALAADTPASTTEPFLDRGFQGMYNLDFAAAQRDFKAWQQEHPEDPMGPVSEAAGLLFSEFNRLGVLEAQFYQSDEAFAHRPKPNPDPAVRDRFQAAVSRAQALARTRLAKDANNHDALLAMTLSSGLQADYAALIEKHNFTAMHYTKEGATWAQQLLAIHPQCYDARVATGFSKYLVGSMSAPVRWLMRLGGLPGDKQGGIADLQLTAEHGHYLAPFARILLAIAYVREKDDARALELLTGLHQDFPENTLFPREIARLQTAH